MEEAICRRFSRDELIKVQSYKEAIFGYLKDNKVIKDLELLYQQINKEEKILIEVRSR